MAASFPDLLFVVGGTMQIPEEQLFAMYGRAVAEAVVLGQQLNAQGAELQAALARVEQLEQGLGEQQQKRAGITAEVASLRKAAKKLNQATIEQEQNLIALNERLMGKKANREYVADQGTGNPI